jgi:hypothetical protein
MVLPSSSVRVPLRIKAMISRRGTASSAIQGEPICGGSLDSEQAHPMPIFGSTASFFPNRSFGRVP